ncbi:hypothetical protein DdX_02147 [Ditylenchus destructor]|uniref:Uncharacterized protein n=1 Tax=Ditylenchus destructor TaxID=166010 RepID=A0AAD4NED0_9BILA|nr:hypothetical protein DdX_02147 [Ditylenchus destructor]
MMNSSFNSLSRSSTPLNGANRPSASPKCFGKNTHILKEDYEREKTRWQQKLDEAAQKLNEASINNSELFQIKAELNRKIIDFEKNQKPLIEQNRRLNDRIRMLSSDTKKLEEKVCHAQDDFLSMRDAYDRLAKENSALKEQRAFPEKLEELSRYRQQVLEYSKCITAIRQSALEKDRRYELLVQKFKKYRKLLLSKRNGTDDDDRQSCFDGSECSADSNSLALDTIAEDLDEDVELTAELLRPSITPTEYSLKQQLDLANMTIMELQNALECGDSPDKLREEIRHLKEQKESLDEIKAKLEKDLANAQEHTDLLEFQLVELTEGSQRRNAEFSDKNMSTDLEITYEDYADSEDDSKETCDTTAESITQNRDILNAILCNKTLLSRSQRRGIRNSIDIIQGLQNKLAFTETDLNMSNCELNRLRRQFEDEISELRRSNEEAATKKQQKKKELQVELEHAKKERKEEVKKATKQIQVLNDTLHEKCEIIRQLNSDIHMNEASLESLRDKSHTDDKCITELKAEIENLRRQLSKQTATADKFKEENASLVRTLQEKDLRIAELQANSDTLQKKMEAIKLEYEELQGQLTELSMSGMDKEDIIKRLEKDLATKVREVEVQKEASCKFEQCIEELRQENERLEKELQEANVLAQALKDQIRPIGTQLERRYEEMRYRLSESLKKAYDLEEQLNNSNERIKQLEQENQSVEKFVQKIQQLETYNQELEQQFNSQMDIIAALKKKFVMLKGNAQSTDSIGWTSNSSEGTNSLADDENYHSEGSEAGRSLKTD